MLRPDVAVVDVSPASGAGFGMARRLCALTHPPAVVLTSSAEPAEFGGRLEGDSFVAKAGLCAEAIRDAAPQGALTRPPQSRPARSNSAATPSKASRGAVTAADGHR